jgi:predicted metalloprotease
VPADADPAQVAADATAAEKIVGGYWIKHFTEDFGSPYQAPTILGIYDGRHPDPHLPTCAGQTLPPDNALYCSEGDFLAFDKGLLSREAEFGNAWVFLIVAHEWGHSIQQRIGASLTAAEAELQADCFAGATLYGAAADGDLTFEAGDVKAITRSLTEVADETPWGQGGDHGDPFQRIGAFDLGRTGGVRGCLPMNPG